MATLQVSSRAALATPAVEVPQHLRCSSCAKPVFNAFQTPHGCRLCNSCVDSLPLDQKTLCPGKTDACRDDDEEIYINRSSCSPDIATRREIGRLIVFCPNKSDGCDWQSKWKDVDAHLTVCKFQKVKCDQCEEWVMQRKLENHQKRECIKRQVKCDQCGQSVVFSDMDKEHKNLESVTCCPKYKSVCPYCRRGREMNRNEFISHVNQCPEKPQDCRYKHLGCTFKARESDLLIHYKNDTHLHIELMDKWLREQAQNRPVAAAVHQAPPQPAQFESTGESTAQHKVVEKFTTMYEMFKKLQVNVANWAHVSIELEETMKDFGGVGKMQEFLKNLEDKLQQTSSEGYGSRSALSTDASVMSDLNQKVALLEKRISKLEKRSDDGNFTWKITEWSIKQSDHLIRSPAFYLTRFGYKFRLKLYPTGISGGSNASLQLIIEQHDFDDTLQWPLNAEASIKLICPSNRNNDVSHPTKKFECNQPQPASSGDNVCFTIEKFIPRRMTADGFVKDNCCYVTVTVTDKLEPKRKRR